MKPETEFSNTATTPVVNLSCLKTDLFMKKIFVLAGMIRLISFNSLKAQESNEKPKVPRRARPGLNCWNWQKPPKIRWQI